MPDSNHVDKKIIRYLYLPSNADIMSCRWSQDGKKIILETFPAVNPDDYYLYPSKPPTFSIPPGTITVDVLSGRISNFNYSGKSFYKPYFSPKRHFIASADKDENLIIQEINKDNLVQKTIIEKKNIARIVMKEWSVNESLLSIEEMYWSPNERYLAFFIAERRTDAISYGIVALYDLKLNNFTILNPFTNFFGGVCVWSNSDDTLYYVKGEKGRQTSNGDWFSSKTIVSFNTADSKTQTLYESKSELHNLRYFRGDLFFLKGESNKDLYRIIPDHSAKKIMAAVDDFDISEKNAMAIIKGINSDRKPYSFFENIYSCNLDTNTLKAFEINKDELFPGSIRSIRWAPDGSKFLLCGYDHSIFEPKCPGFPVITIIYQ
ncbi:MAG: hypothetical protein AB2L14_37195 [Candidatus Xenobiia bacterium LiM19]